MQDEKFPPHQSRSLGGEKWMTVREHESLTRDLVEALYMALAASPKGEDHDWYTCNQPSCIFARQVLSKFKGEQKWLKNNT